MKLAEAVLREVADFQVQEDRFQVGAALHMGTCYSTSYMYCSAELSVLQNMFKRFKQLQQDDLQSDLHNEWTLPYSRHLQW